MAHRYRPNAPPEELECGLAPKDVDEKDIHNHHVRKLLNTMEDKVFDGKVKLFQVFRKFDMTLSGHFHKKSHMDNIWYLGSPFEQTWIDCDEERGFHVLDTDTMELEFIPNPHKMFFKIFYNGTSDVNPTDYTDKAVKIIINQIDDQYMFSKFIEEMEAAGPWHMQIIDNTDASDTSEVEVEHIESKGTVELLNDYIEQTKYDNKDEVKALMRELFDEAIASS